MTLTENARTALTPAASARSGDDPIFQLNAEATRRALAGESIVNATLGALMEDDGTLAVLPSVIEALQRVPPRRAAAYAPIAGEASFREAVVRDTFGADRLASLAVSAATPGGTGAIQAAVASFLEPGQALLTTHWFWGPYQTIASHARRGVETFPTFGADGRFDLAGFESALDRLVAKQGRALIVLNSPCHNPTGYSLDEAEWQGVSEIVRRAGERAPVALLVDLAYASFGQARSHAWTEQAEKVLESATLLVAWTASKSFAQYGARVGALLAVHQDAAERTRLANALAFACRGTWSNCNHLGMLAITECLRDPKLRERCERERARLVALLGERVDAFNREARRVGLRHPRYEGGFFVAAFAHDGEAAAARARERGVYVVPMPGAVRVALCSTPVRDVPRLVEALAEACAE